MKTGVNFILIALLISGIAYAQNASHKIIGRWQYKGVENSKKQAVECPDMLVFNPDGNYQILNDCYSVTTQIPTIEQGNWIYDPKDKKITLKNRKFTTNVTFHDSSAELTLYIKGGTGKLLKICFNYGECIVEKYERIPDANKEDSYLGEGNSVKELQLTGKVTAIRLSYHFYNESDQLIVEDKNGLQLYKTEMTNTNSIQTVTIPLKGVSKLVFKITSGHPKSKWWFKVEPQ
ncbi:MAG: hypothetical protein K1X81_03440 [Bacteroidia bacterium]|nr:hypothetical protein [Bacteroidia bacterium]